MDQTIKRTGAFHEQLTSDKCCYGIIYSERPK